MKKFPFFANVLRLNPHSLLPWPCQIMPAKLTKFWQEEIIFTSQYMLFCCPNLHSLYKESIYCFFYLKTLYIFFQSTEYNKFSRNGMKMAFTNIFMAECWSFQRSAHSRPVGPTDQWQTSDPTYEPLWADLWKDQHTAISLPIIW